MAGLRVILHDTVTGDFVSEVPFISVEWTTGVNRADDVKVVIPAYTDFPVWPYLTPRRYTITPVFEDGSVPAAGVVGGVEIVEDEAGQHLITMDGQGIESVFRRVPVLPAAFWPLLDGSGNPILTRDTDISGVDYGTMMKRLYLQALDHPGAPELLAFQPDRVGTRQKGWNATDGKPVQEAVDDISELLGGVEWDWVPNLTGNENLQVGLITATDAERELADYFEYQWTVGGTDADVGPITLKISPEFFCSTAIFTGGKGGDGAGEGGDRVMMSRALNNEILNAGAPFHFVWDSSHSSVSHQATLDGWAARRAVDGGAPIQFWSFRVRAKAAPNLRHGAYANLIVDMHPFIPDGVYRLRIVEVKASVGESGIFEWYDVVVEGVSEWL